jgi:hypothetical protein
MRKPVRSAGGATLVGWSLLAAGVALAGFATNNAIADSHAKSDGRSRCTRPVHAQLVATDAQVRIVFVPRDHTDSDGTYIRGVYESCLRARGRWSTFAEDSEGDGGLGDLVDVGPLKLAGAYFAYTTSTVSDGGRYGATPETVLQITDVATRAVRSAGSGGVQALALTASGIAAWQGESFCGSETSTSSYRVCVWSLNAFDAKIGWSGILDSTPSSQSTGISDPFSGPAIYTCAAGCTPAGGTVVWWQRDGTWHSAPVG